MNTVYLPYWWHILLRFAELLRFNFNSFFPDSSLFINCLCLTWQWSMSYVTFPVSLWTVLSPVHSGIDHAGGNHAKSLTLPLDHQPSLSPSFHPTHQMYNIIFNLSMTGATPVRFCVSLGLLNITLNKIVLAVFFQTNFSILLCILWLIFLKYWSFCLFNLPIFMGRRNPRNHWLNLLSTLA